MTATMLAIEKFRFLKAEFRYLSLVSAGTCAMLLPNCQGPLTSQAVFVVSQAAALKLHHCNWLAETSSLPFNPN